MVTRGCLSHRICPWEASFLQSVVRIKRDFWVPRKIRDSVTRVAPRRTQQECIVNPRVYRPGRSIASGPVVPPGPLG